MKLKAKLISTIAAFCMVICLLTVGIWAASNASVTIKGNVSFSAQDVEATVTGTFAGCVETEGLTKAVTFTTTGVNDDNDDGTTDETQVFEQVWENLNYTFVKNADGSIANITLTINVKNNSTERNLKVSITDSSEDGDVTFDFTNVTDDELAPGADKDYVVTMSTTKTASDSFDGDFNILVSLANGDVVNQG